MFTVVVAYTNLLTYMRVFGLGFVLKLLQDETPQTQNPCHFDPLLCGFLYLAWFFDSCIPL